VTSAEGTHRTLGVMPPPQRDDASISPPAEKRPARGPRNEVVDPVQARNSGSYAARP
jgi:hypothetical protein